MNISTLLPFAALVFAGAALAQQPQLTIPVVNHPCEDGPKMVGGKPETYEAPLENGFVSIFNGTDLKGWWENCATHTTDTRVGGVWIVDPSSKILYSREEGPNGDILMTNQNFEHYEFIMDLWPTYGNDGGIFNRVTRTGKNWQTTIDYIQGSGVGGSFNEKQWASFNINEDPFKFGSAGESSPEITTWTTFTKALNPASFGCSANGCVSSDFPKIWNINGWNQIRLKFYGGLVPGEPVKMETWIRKLQTPEAPWVPVYKSQQSVATPAGPIALQIHGGGRWKAGTYNLYRNIMVRRLDKDGVPLITGTIGQGRSHMKKSPELTVANGSISGALNGNYHITLRDLKGNRIESISASSGSFRHTLPQRLRGIFFVELKGDEGISRIRLTRI